MIYVSRSSNWSMEMHLMLGCLLFSSKAYKQMIGHMHGSQNYWKPLGFHGNRRNRSSLVSSDNWFFVKKTNLYTVEKQFLLGFSTIQNCKPQVLWTLVTCGYGTHHAKWCTKSSCGFCSKTGWTREPLSTREKYDPASYTHDHLSGIRSKLWAIYFWNVNLQKQDRRRTVQIYSKFSRYLDYSFQQGNKHLNDVVNMERDVGRSAMLIPHWLWMKG